MQGLIRRVVAATALAAVAIPAFALGVSQPIQITDNEFTPADPDVVAAGTSSHQWQWLGSNAHNVRQDRKLFFSGQPAVDDDLVITASAGTFPYYCEVHGAPGAGMHGKLRIRPAQLATEPDPSELRIGVRWALESLQTGDRFDVQYRIGQHDWERWRSNTSKTEGVFGRNDNPVEVKPGKTYRFRARSELAANPDRASGFSPALAVVPEI